MKSMSGEEVAHLISVLSVTLSVESHRLLVKLLLCVLSLSCTLICWA